jgi:hypothetical protein
MIWMIEFLVLAFNKDKKRLGDQLAKTAVVKTREMSILKKIMVILSAIIIIFAIIFISIVFILKGSEAYITAENYIENNSAIIEETGGVEGFGFLPTGSMQISNGHGEAFFTVTVKGEENDIYVDIYLTKEPRNVWHVQDVHYYE